MKMRGLAKSRGCLFFSCFECNTRAFSSTWTGRKYNLIMMGGALLNKCRGELKINEVLDHFVRYVIRNNDNDNLFI